MKRKLTRIGLIIGTIALFLWTLTIFVESLAYGIDSGDALGATLQMGIPIIPILAYMYFIHKISKWLNVESTG